MMDNQSEGGSRPEGADHPFLEGAQRVFSRMESIDGDKHITYDPETAHQAAGDTRYEKFLPETCGSCRAREIAWKAAKGEA